MSLRGRPPVRSTGELEFLATGRMRLLGLMPRASNFTFLSEVSDRERRDLAVYKPRNGETRLWDFPPGTLCRREVAAYVLAEELGWPRVPPTVLRSGPHGLGSVQLFVDASLEEHFFTIRERELGEFLPVAAFDVVANNADRKAGHCLLAADGMVWVVDHGLCFSVEPKLRTVIWDFAGEELPEGLREDLLRAAAALRSGPLERTMSELLTSDEIAATAQRAEALALAGRFPHPGRGRHYPWPPV